MSRGPISSTSQTASEAAQGRYAVRPEASARLRAPSERRPRRCVGLAPRVPRTPRRDPGTQLAGRVEAYAPMVPEMLQCSKIHLLGHGKRPGTSAATWTARIEVGATDRLAVVTLPVHLTLQQFWNTTMPVSRVMFGPHRYRNGNNTTMNTRCVKGAGDGRAFLVQHPGASPTIFPGTGDATAHGDREVSTLGHSSHDHTDLVHCPFVSFFVYVYFVPVVTSTMDAELVPLMPMK